MARQSKAAAAPIIASAPKAAKKAARVRPGARARVALGPGLHGGVVELATDRRYRVRTLGGERIVAVLGVGVDRALADECLRDGRLVILADTPSGPAIMGALQTSRGLALEPDGTALIRARKIRLQADRSLVLEAGTTTLRLDDAGAVRAQGDRMVIDMGSHVRVVSALCELP